jgi:hypothetical protein
VVCITLVAVLVSVMVAFTKAAPLESRTVPTIAPVSIWECAAEAQNSNAAKMVRKFLGMNFILLKEIWKTNAQ